MELGTIGIRCIKCCSCKYMVRPNFFHSLSFFGLRQHNRRLHGYQIIDYGSPWAWFTTKTPKRGHHLSFALYAPLPSQVKMQKLAFYRSRVKDMWIQESLREVVNSNRFAGNNNDFFLKILVVCFSSVECCVGLVLLTVAGKPGFLRVSTESSQIC